MLNVLPGGGRLLIHSLHTSIVAQVAANLYPHKDLRLVKTILVSMISSTRSSVVPPALVLQPTGGLVGICNEHRHKTFAHSRA